MQDLFKNKCKVAQDKHTKLCILYLDIQSWELNNEMSKYLSSLQIEAEVLWGTV